MSMETPRLSWRSLWRNRRRTLITVTSIAFGLGLAVFFEALADGMYSKLAADAARMQAGDITVQHRDYLDAPSVDLFVEHADALQSDLRAVPGVDDVKLLVQAQGIARSSHGAVGVAFIGIDTAIEAKTSPIAKKIVDGRYLTAEDDARVVIGRKLADRLKLEVGKKLVLSSNDADGNLVEQLFRVAGIFATGSDAIDAYIVQARAPELATLLQLPEGAATQVGVLLRDPEELETILPAVAANVNAPAQTYDWRAIMPELANYIRVDHGSLKVTLWILIFLVLFTILNTVMMSVVEREREFAVLMAIGTPPGRIVTQVWVETFFTGLIGCVAGALIGVAGAYYVQLEGIDLRSMYETQDMEVGGFAIDLVMYARVKASTVLRLTAMVLAATMLTAIPGVWRLSHLDLTARMR